jgi:hypothetical protein
LKVNIDQLNRKKVDSPLGLAGTIYYMADLLDPTHARFPAFE